MPAVDPRAQEKARASLIRDAFSETNRCV